MRLTHLLPLLAAVVSGWGAHVQEPGPDIAHDPAPTTRPEQVDEMARILHEEPWAARIVATISESTATSNEPIGTPRSDEMFVWYDPEGLVCLSLGMLRIEVRNGSLLAIHVRNGKAIYETTHKGLSIAEVIRAELPPLWCPWLSMALSGGDPTVWPAVGHPGRRLDRGADSLGGGIGSGPYFMTGYTLTDATGTRSANLDLVIARHSVGTQTFDSKRIDAPGVWMRDYTLAIRDGRNKRVIRFDHDFALPDSWNAIDIDGREPAASLADLGPPTPQLTAGDRCPVVNLSFPDPERDALKTWKPSRAFMYPVRGTDERPKAVVLAITRPGLRAPPTMLRFSAAVAAARPGLLQDPRRIRFAAHPVVATDATQDAMTMLPALEEVWVSQQPELPEVDDRGRDDVIPIISALPASLLLDRVAPGADAAIVVVDRSGWITGVIGPELTGDDLADAIAEAVRSAAR
jgi:hypothetical protein